MPKKTSPIHDKTVKNSAGIKKSKSKYMRREGDPGKKIKIQKALYEIATATSAVTDMQEFYAALHRIVGKLMYAKSFYVTLYDATTGMLSSPYFADESGDPPPPPTKIDKSNKSLRGYVLLKKKTLHVSAEEIEAGRQRGKFEPKGTPAEDWIGVPLKMGGQIIGSLTIQSYKKGVSYEEYDVQLLEFVAQHIAVALTRARAIDETRQRNAELAIINSVQEGLAGRLNIQAIYELVGENIRKTFDAQVVSIDTYDRAVELLHSRYYFEGGRSIPGSKYTFFGFRKHVIENRQSLVINSDMSRWMEEYSNPVNLGTQPKSAIFVPMIVDDEALGVISLQNNDQENAFSEADLRLLTTLSNSMSIALENARLWEEERKYRKALERELEIGREIQIGFLPEALPQVEGWEIAASLLSAREVAGDFYDAFELPDGTIGLVIADVCDKGVGAALFMTLFRSLIRATANLEYFEHTGNTNMPQSSAERLKRAMSLTNNYIAETHGDSGMFATLFFGILDPRDGRLIYINGGHEPPLIIRSGNVYKTLPKTGPAVGAITDGNFEIYRSQLHEGDVLLAFTDGVMDCQNPRGDFYERRQLLEVLHRANDSSRDLINAIEDDLYHHIAGATQFDDITLLAIRREKYHVA